MASPRESARKERHRRRPPIGLAREELEVRLVPAIVAAAPALPPAVASLAMSPVVTILPTSGTSPTGFTPQQIRAAYGFSQAAFGSLPANGAGQTIAIVDAYDDPGLVNSTAANFATSDLAMFDSQFGLPNPPSFTKINEYGSTTSLPGTDPAGPGSPSGNWEYEEAMDVEWAHALAPDANIVLVEANSAGFGDLYKAVTTAASLPGVSTVSLSWGSSEFHGESSWNSEFLTPAGHQGVTFVAATGDGGAPGLYPAYSPTVVAAGGTNLQIGANGSYQSETAWPSSGGGTSTHESEPAYQKGVQSTGQRTIPDVSFQADRTIGVAVYDSYDNTGGGPWTSMGGTSLAAPAWAALIAVADQGRVAEGGTTLDGATQTLPALYSLPATDFHDITTGSNGTYSAGPGYDQVTGLGSPVANLLIPDLAFYGMLDHLVVTAQPPASATAGGGFGLTVEVESPDGSPVTGASGTITVALSQDPGGASLGGTLTATINGGVATFSGLTINQAGSGYTLSVSGSGFTSATSASFDVAAAAGTQLLVTAQPPSSLTAGDSFGLTVDVQDAYGNLAAGYDGTVSLALSGGPAGASLGGTITTLAVDGVATFSGLSIDQAGGGYALAVDATGLATVDTTSFAVTPAASSSLVLTTGLGSSVVAGSSFGVSVSVDDAYGNPVADSNGAVTLSLLDGPAGASLSGTLQSNLNGGLAGFSGLALDRASAGYVIQASSPGLSPVDTPAFAVAPAAPAALAIAAEPTASVTAGGGFGLTVDVRDAYGNLVTGYGGEVTIGLVGGPSDATLRGTLGESASGGVATFSGLSIVQAGSGYSIEASGGGLTTASSTAVTVTPAAASQLVVTVQPPSTVTAGSSFGLSVSAEDPYGNLATGFDGNVSAALAGGPSGALLGGGTSVTAANGVASFTGLILSRDGKGYALDATSPGLSGANTAAFGVLPATPARLVVTTEPPSSVTAGSRFGLAVAVEDAYGNVVTGESGKLTVSMAGGASESSLTGTTAVQLQDGVGTFSGLTIDRAGAGDSLHVEASGLRAVMTSAFQVVPGAPSQLVITSQPPGGVVAGQAFGFGVQAEDAYGNVVTTFDGPVTAALVHEPAGGSLTGTATTTAANGVAEFSGLILDTAALGDALRASSGNLSSGVTAPIAVSSAPASRLVLIVQPDGSVVRRKPFVLAVEAEDAYGNVATGFDGAVRAALSASSRHNRLAGDLATQASGGEAVIAGARLNRSGHAYAITLTSSGLTPAATSVFRVTRPSRGSISAARRADQVHPRVHDQSHVHFPFHGHVRARELPAFHPRRHGR